MVPVQQTRVRSLGDVYRRGVDRLRRRVAIEVTRRGLRALSRPVSTVYGFDRGTPLDRPHIEAFLQRHQGDVRGRTLEVKDDGYSVAFGGTQVERRDILDIDASNERATVIADLNVPGSLIPDAYDCIVLTQVIQFLRPDVALPMLYGALRPSGTILISGPVLTALEPAPPDLWRYTAAGLEAVLRDNLPDDATIHAEQHGDAVTAAAFILGYSVQDLGARKERADDGRFPVVALARVRRP